MGALLEIPVGDIELDFSVLRPGLDESRGADAALLLAYCATLG